jgi:PTS system mannose-specific IIA component
MIGCLVISHGDIAQSLVNTSQKIAGDCDALFSLSSDGQTNQVADEIKSLIAQERFSEGVIIMVCLHGGSGWNISRALTNGRSNVALISGTNLPMVLSFITKRNMYPFDELVDLVTEDAKKGVFDIKM